ncbi:hypothetical protein [Planococcus citreus]|uniref:Uncharacterized protein n=1 Tax=Planococcus citreus TaxID=1373 RepID=A0A497YG38_9BACL|nr:hypothetical protein [Planococcus citreus]RLJ89916.1 hypothetical protein DFR62_0056 [Planococcus citreus]
MQLFVGFVPVIILVLASIINLIVLNSKNEVGRAFLTDEQKTKVYYFNLVMFSFVISIAFFSFFISYQDTKLNGEAISKPEILAQGISLALFIFIIFLFMSGRVAKWFQNYRVKYHYKYKVDIPNIGTVYIIRMLNKEVCICSEDPNFEFRGSKDKRKRKKKTFLIPFSEILRQPLIKEKITKVKQTNFEKFFE